ncbi:hypothetical protein ACXYTP_21695 [Tsukamurella ocularis]
MTLDELRDAVLSLPRNDGPQLLADLDDEGVTRLAPELIAAVVGNVWAAVEYPENAVAAAEWAAWFRTAGSGRIIHDERGPIPAPTEVPVLYRGGKLRDRMSWTADIEVARKFAEGIAFRPTDGTIWAIRDLPPELVLAHVDGPKEAEWVIDIAAYAGVPEVVEESDR